jgi:hypothetical protein
MRVIGQIVLKSLTDVIIQPSSSDQAGVCTHGLRNPKEWTNGPTIQRTYKHAYIHDGAAWFVLRDDQLPNSCTGARRQSAHVIRHLKQCSRQRTQACTGVHQCVVGGEGAKLVRSRHEWMTSFSSDVRGSKVAELRMGIQPSACGD